MKFTYHATMCAPDQYLPLAIRQPVIVAKQLATLTMTPQTLKLSKKKSA